MPIRPELRKFYGWKWRTVTRPAILLRAGGAFDDDGRYLGGARCMRCDTPDLYPLSIWQRSLIECAHLSGDPADDSPENTGAFCHPCHRALDYQQWADNFHAWLLKEAEKRRGRKDRDRPILVLLEEAS